MKAIITGILRQIPLLILAVFISVTGFSLNFLVPGHLIGKHVIIILVLSFIGFFIFYKKRPIGGMIFAKWDAVSTKNLLCIDFNNNHKYERLSYLDGLRGWAALTVAWVHTFGWIDTLRPYLGETVWNYIFLDGHLAVMIFFVLSGFSLSVSFVRTNSVKSLSALLAGRYFRLSIPILLASLITYCTVIFGWTNSSGIIESCSSVWKIIDFATHSVFTIHADLYWPNTPLWTMPYELLGSLTIIIILLICGKWKNRWAMYGFLWIIVIYDVNLPAKEYYMAFFIGLIFCEIRHLSLPVTMIFFIKKYSFVLFIGACIAMAINSQPSDRYYLYASSAIVAGVVFSDIGTAFFSNRISIFLGKISFPIYLMHFLVINTFGEWLDHAIPRTTYTTFLGATVIDSVTLVVVIVSGCLTVWIDTSGIVMGKYVGGLFLRTMSALSRRVARHWRARDAIIRTEAFWSHR